MFLSFFLFGMFKNGFQSKIKKLGSYGYSLYRQLRGRQVSFTSQRKANILYMRRLQVNTGISELASIISVLFLSDKFNGCPLALDLTSLVGGRYTTSRLLTSIRYRRGYSGIPAVTMTFSWNEVVDVVSRRISRLYLKCLEISYHTTDRTPGTLLVIAFTYGLTCGWF